MSGTGESWRNSARTRSRNDKPMKKLMTDSQSTALNDVFIQYCRERTCRQVQAFLVPYTDRDLPRLDLEQVRLISSTNNVPLFGFHHVFKDELHDPSNGGVKLSTWEPHHSQPSVEQMSWGQAMVQLYQLQTKHVHNSDNMLCGPPRYEDKWLRKETARGIGNADFTLSNAIRCIPGVGHIDLDEIVYCPSCGDLLIIIEGSSDGAPNTAREHVTKHTYLSQSIARQQQCQLFLIQHSVHDDDHEFAIRLTIWGPGHKTPVMNKVGIWQDAVDAIIGVRQSHQCTTSSVKGSVC